MCQGSLHVSCSDQVLMLRPSFESKRGTPSLSNRQKTRGAMTSQRQTIGLSVCRFLPAVRSCSERSCLLCACGTTPQVIEDQLANASFREKTTA